MSLTGVADGTDRQRGPHRPRGRVGPAIHIQSPANIPGGMRRMLRANGGALLRLHIDT